MVFEAGERPGGLSVTFEHDGFRFDSGAHRFHDKDPGITRDVRELLGDGLRVVDCPSVVFDGGRLMRFPFRLSDVLGHLGPAMVARGALELAVARLTRPETESFAALAVGRYGRTLAERFLLGYSRKLWGIPGERLSPRASGERLQGLDLRQFLLQTLLGRGADRRSADGAFSYPTRGIGMLADALARGCGPGAVRTGARVGRLVHDGARIGALELESGERHAVDSIVSTVPLDQLVAMLSPPPPAHVLAGARGLEHRSLVLVALFLQKESVTPFATVYFPDPGLPFTRVTEPRNRSDAMSPPGHSSLVAEIPCACGDPVWSADDSDLVRLVGGHLEAIGWIRDREILGARVERLAHAYPVLSLEAESRAGEIRRYLGGLANLSVAGRNGRFEYGWIHDMLRDGKEVVATVGGDPRGDDARHRGFRR